MKTIIKIVLIFLVSCSSYSQIESDMDINHLTPFVGNWVWVDGNQTFKVEIYVEGNYLKGDYKLVEVNNGVETEIYNSNILMNEEENFYFGHAIFGGSYDGINFGGHISDNVLFSHGTHLIKDGNFEFILQNNCSSCPITATWKVSILQGMKSTNEPEEFTIPTDIVLTKVN